MGPNSCQPEGLQPESAMAALLVLAIERLLPSPGALPSPILAATHTCFIMLGTLRIESLDRVDHRVDLRVRDAKIKRQPQQPVADRIRYLEAAARPREFVSAR